MLFAWARAKGAVIVTFVQFSACGFGIADKGYYRTSRSEERLKDYLAAGDLVLSEEDIRNIDEAGARFDFWQYGKRALGLAAVSIAFVGLKWWID